MDGTFKDNYFHDEIPFRPSSQDLICQNCSRKNKAGSRFCDKCGNSFVPSCKNCGNSKNLPNASFCNKCGAKIDEGSQNKNYQFVNNDSRRQNDKKSIDFSECLSIKYSLKFNYPSSFTKIDRVKNDLNIIFAFQQIDKKSDVKYPPEITISVRNLNPSYRDLKQNSEEIVEGIIKVYSDAFLSGCFSSQVGNTLAYQYIITFSKKKETVLFCTFKNRLYTFRFSADHVRFSADYGDFIKILYQFEEFKNSIEFLA